MREYIVGDAKEVVGELVERQSADLVHLDDAWARPKRCGAFGVEYPTHDFTDPEGVSVADMIDLSFELLADGGWLIVSTDDWLLPRALNYIREHHGDVNATYEGGGYRKTGRVVYTKADGTPHRGGRDKYLRKSGYPVIFAHKGETDRTSTASAVQFADKPTEHYGWGSTKPIAPYETWIDGLTERGDTVVEPAAGTAPACLAAERLYGTDVNYTAIDTKEGARDACRRRRCEEL